MFLNTIATDDDDDPSRTATSSVVIGDDLRDCFWTRYYPQLPIWGISFKQEWDRVWDYYEWNCNYYDDTDRWEEEAGNVENEVVNGMGELEPSNFVE